MSKRGADGLPSARPSWRAQSRWGAAAGLLEQMRWRPGVTRVEAARTIGLSTGAATQLTARLRDCHLLVETPARIQGPGRPTTVLEAHPRGPLLIVVDIRHRDWRTAVATLDGRTRTLDAGDHNGGDPTSTLASLRASIGRETRRRRGRARAVAVSVAGTIADGRLVQAATLGWGPVDLTGLSAEFDLPLLLGNDATLAGVAEARGGAAAGARTSLHLHVDVGLGGTLVVGGRPVGGATGAAGEFGHLPFGDLTLRCPCGALGCWELEVDGRAIARRLDEPPPADPHATLLQALDRAPTDGPTTQAITAATEALARGVAGLVNAHDPDVVTLGGLAGPLRAATRDAFDSTYTDGLMAFHRTDPPPVVDALHGPDGPMRGAVAMGLDHLGSEQALADWGESR